jgi:plastocyanin
MRSSELRAACIALAFACFLGAASDSFSGPQHAAAGSPGTAEAVHTVIIEQLQFHPAVLVVHRGDRIVWLNRDLFPHTVTATAKAFDSGSIPAGGTWKYRARRSGEYDYGCTFHPTMKATLIVR